MIKTMRRALFLFATLNALTVSVAIAAGDVARGKTISMQGNGAGAIACMVCHGPDGKGNAAAGFPHIAGLNAGYLGKQLHDYASETRKNPVMKPMASSMTDDDISAVAAYYESLKSSAPTVVAYQPADPANQGEWLAVRGDWDNSIPGCNQCHGPNGVGVGESFPTLAGQHSGYLKTQLNAWRAGDRDNDPNQLMKGIAERLSEAQINLIADYYANLPAQLKASPKAKESH